MIEEISYHGWKRNLLIRRDDVELVITLDVGPRLLRYGFVGALNVFKEYPEQLGQSGEPEWCIRGGHRFWTAPEDKHSYALDNIPVTHEITGDNAVTVLSPPQKEFGYQKTLRIAMHEGGAVTIEHVLKNISSKPLDITPWSLSVMAPGGTAIIPQPPFRPHPMERAPGTPEIMADYLPNRNMTLWPFTSLGDPRFTWEQNAWKIKQSAQHGATKLGLKLDNIWVAYDVHNSIFCKFTPYEKEKAASYPDNGVNFEMFTNREMLELECLSPLEPLAPGATRTLVENWHLFRETVNWSDAAATTNFFARLAPPPVVK